MYSPLYSSWITFKTLAPQQRRIFKTLTRYVNAKKLFTSNKVDCKISSVMPMLKFSTDLRSHIIYPTLAWCKICLEQRGMPILLKEEYVGNFYASINYKRYRTIYNVFAVVSASTDQVWLWHAVTLHNSFGKHWGIQVLK